MRREPDPSNLVAFALAYAERGYRVIPLYGVRVLVGKTNDDKAICTCWRGVTCASPGKHPRTKDWRSLATADPKTIRSWWQKWPDSNLGITTGRKSDLVVIDIDSRKSGEEGLARLEGRYGGLPDTVESLTGGGGRHLAFRYPALSVGVTIGNRTNLTGISGVDVRGTGGFIVAPPSLHASGQRYQWAVEHDLRNGTKPARLPAAWAVLLSTGVRSSAADGAVATAGDLNPGSQPMSRVKRPSAGTTDFLANTAPEGTRNDRLFRAAADLCGCGWQRAAAEDVLLPAAIRSGLSEVEIRRTIESAYSQPRTPTCPRVQRSLQDGRRKPGNNFDRTVEVGPVTVQCRSHLREGTTVEVRHGADVLDLDSFDLAKAAKRNAFVDRIVKSAGEDLRKPLDDALKELALQVAVRSNDDTADLTVPDRLATTPEEVKESAREMLRDPALMQRIAEDTHQLGVTGETRLVQTIYLVGCSRILERPLAGIVQAPSSSGKSFVIMSVADLFPAEAIIVAHAMTPEALAHMPPGSLKHRVVVGGERRRHRDDKSADATKALREMISDGRLRKLMPMKQPGGSIETVLIEQEGPIAYIESTTQNDIIDEDRNRCLLLATDERREQTERIIREMAARKERGHTGPPDDLIQRHHAMQRMLRRVSVRIPFALQLSARFPCDRTEARRYFGQLLSMIESVAALHQFQRTAEPADGVIISATRDDYEIARNLLAEPLARAQGGTIAPALMRFFDRLKLRPSSRFTSVDVARDETVIRDPQTIRRYLAALASSGHLDVIEPNRGSKPAVYEMRPDTPVELDACGLPHPNDLVF